MATKSGSTTTGAGSSSAPTILQILPTTRNPQIWKDYNLCKMSDNTSKAQCKHCFHFFSQNSNSTLKNHISHPHCEALKTVPEAGQSSMSRDGSVFVYNPDVLREQFARLVIQQGLPFNHFDNTQMTRVFQNNMQPKYNHVLIESISTDLEFFDDGFATKAKERFNDSFQGSSRNQMTTLLNKLKQYKKAKHDRLATSEYERYVESDFVSHLSTEELAGYDVLGFWKANESTFPVISQMARDILSVQATSVASESAFSTSADRVQHTSNLENSLDFEAEILEEEVQEHEAIALSDEEVALDEAASEARSSEGEEIYDMTLSEFCGRKRKTDNDSEDEIRKEDSEAKNDDNLNYEDVAVDSEVEEVSETIFKKEQSQAHNTDEFCIPLVILGYPLSCGTPRSVFEKKISWEYLIYVIGNWNGDVVIIDAVLWAQRALSHFCGDNLETEDSVM
ncbi:zinc finger BED domain-containing protein RICESLEEPER 2-like protein [Tanacetum coccineum]